MKSSRQRRRSIIERLFSAALRPGCRPRSHICLCKRSPRDEFGLNWSRSFSPAWLSANVCCCWIGRLDFLRLSEDKKRAHDTAQGGGGVWMCRFHIHSTGFTSGVSRSFHVADLRGDNFRTFFIILLSSWWHQVSQSDNHLEWRI